jgi:hypothetical protein
VKGPGLLLDIAERLADDAQRRAVVELVGRGEEVAQTTGEIREQCGGETRSERVRIGRVDRGAVDADQRRVAALLEEAARVAKLEDPLAEGVAGERVLPGRAREGGLRLEPRRGGDPAAAGERECAREIVEARQYLRGVDALAQGLGRRQRAQRSTSRKSSRNPCVS